ncbi:MAG: DUF4340 domain-containing protein [Spirochaetales bacterium]|nr:DUF4340 domain-containing protein [Spirochaetales bacterium]
MKKRSIFISVLIITAASAAIFYFTGRKGSIPEEIPKETVIEKPAETPEEIDPETPAAGTTAENPAEIPSEKPPVETAEDDGPKTLFNMPGESVISFKLVDKGRTVSLRKVNGTWSLESSSLSRIDPGKVLPYIRELSTLDSVRTVSFSSEANGAKGIDPGSRSITISDGTETRTIYPGSYSDGEEGYYLALEGSDEIYLVKSDPGSALKMRADDLRDRNLPMPDLSDISTLAIEGSSPLAVIPYKRFDQFAPDSFIHMLDSPYSRLVPVNEENFISFLNSIGSPLKIADFIDKGNPADYGIDTGRPDFSMADRSGKALILHLGKPAGAGKVYAKLGTEEQLFTLESGNLEFLNTAPFSLADRQIRPVDRDKIDTINIITPDLALMIGIDRMGGRPTFTLNGMEISEKDFSELYETVSSLRLSGEVKTGASTSSSYLTISWKLKDGGSRWAETKFHPYDGNNYAVTQYEDYPPLFLIDRKQVAAMVKKLTATADRIYGF